MRKSGGIELNARDVFFRPVTLSAREIIATLFHRRLLLFLILVAVTLTLADPGRLLPVMPLWRAALTWLVAVGTQTLSFAGLALVWAWAQKRLGAPVIMLPLIGLAAYAVTFSSTILHISLETGRPLGTDIRPETVMSGYLIALVFETLYFSFVLPVLLREIRTRDRDHPSDAPADAPPDGSPAPTRHICIAGERLPIDEIGTLRSREHFVLVSTPQGQKAIRARLGDLIPQTEESDGVLAHRSYWIARHAISHIEQENGADIIVTHDGERLKVAQTRQEEVRRWLDRHAPEISPRGGPDAAVDQGAIRRDTPPTR